MRPNEIGRIPILEYHTIGSDPEYEDIQTAYKKGLAVAPETFREQLQMMYDAGWYPVNMRDVLTARISVPARKIPVVLTFDDARPSQFRYLKDSSLDPDCAVGILEAFHKTHPDWPRRATFYVLPESRWNGVPFDQDGLETRKLRFLVRAGYEIGNHTTSHRSLRDMNAGTLRWEMAACVRYVKRRAPGATMDTMALPYGIGPRDFKLWNVLLHGRYGRTDYHNGCILLDTGGPAYSPVDKRFNPKRVTRILSKPGNIERWIQLLKPGSSIEPFVSDGDPNTVTIPAPAEKDLDRSRLHGAHLVTDE